MSEKAADNFDEFLSESSEEAIERDRRRAIRRQLRSENAVRPRCACCRGDLSGKLAHDALLEDMGCSANSESHPNIHGDMREWKNEPKIRSANY
jgi:hypothetical protein